MDFELKTLDLAEAARQKCDALVVLVAEGFKPGSDPVSRLAGTALKAGDLETKPGKLLQAYRAEGVTAPRLILAGAGDGSARRVQSAVQAAVSALRAKGIKRIVVCLAPAADEFAVRAAVLAAADASYVYVATKSKAEGRALERVTLAVADATTVRVAFDSARATAAGVEAARELGNLPPNVATPTRLGEEARKLAKAHGFQCEVLGPKEVARLGMGSFMAVAQGSSQPLRFIVLKYVGAPASQAPVVLVGKGITFDSGGISIKPAPEMDEMKFDMCGAASVLGVFRALGELRPAINVVGLVPTCENLPDGGSFKPGDVVTSMSGQTIEVLNTDAEGRLVLCDALTYAERFKPAAVVDVATLTGACVIALGAIRSGLFASDDGLARALQEAGDAALDLCWRMPLDDEYGEGLKTNFADVANVAGRQGGAITAAKFLQRFAAKYPWAHLDIAGTAWKGGPSKGATGRPVPLLVQYLLSQAGPATGKARAARRKAAA
ncbi:MULTISPECIES: leucyl aminopeptidase [Ramlibacter]|uniref:Probable cytosol aminopeptidase n=1 Tax=Ramlibacter pinisoli TaxID=2682844 RepID=A0A6N8IV44_9BURK|nr:MULTISPECIES: leucyl aminopeptidase [Ramlibacter]MBA2960864.1 leucyl aminopeptidase [Ramlibacter sp. CGMCC 1.13660]MVQ30811.1 leucyl aminopeptidase [Ramlibacter pinisoli]